MASLSVTIFAEAEAEPDSLGPFELEGYSFELLKNCLSTVNRSVEWATVNPLRDCCKS
jgi:hypothetical protein